MNCTYGKQANQLVSRAREKQKKGKKPKAENIAVNAEGKRIEKEKLNRKTRDSRSSNKICSCPKKANGLDLS
jgi:hypothetical protein